MNQWCYCFNFIYNNDVRKPLHQKVIKCQPKIIFEYVIKDDFYLCS